MHIDNFDFNLPSHLIAKRPIRPRDRARMLYIGKDCHHLRLRDLPQILRSGDCAVFNDSRVIRGNIIGYKQGKAIGFTLLEKGGKTWKALARPAKWLKIGDCLDIGSGGVEARITSSHEKGVIEMRFSCSEQELGRYLSTHGHMPIPPYIASSRKSDRQDFRDYQTIFAKHETGAAAPTAGLHFTHPLLAVMRKKGIKIETLSLRVGLGSFAPIRVADINQHKMHSEYGIITAQTALNINHSKQRKGRILAVGTTVLRLLESAVSNNGNIRAFKDRTDIYITPGWRFRTADILLTNFHMPRSSLFILVSAFGGVNRAQKAYETAIKNNYRFYSYGDCCLIEKRKNLEIY